MDCKRANELLVDVLYEEIGAAERKALDSHVKRCAACRKELASLKKTRAMMQEMRDVEPPEHLDGAIMEAASQDAPAEPAILQVFIFRDGDFIGTDMFTEPEVSIGRDPSVADLVLESTQVSRRHAILRQDGQRVTIHDAGSTNGIYIGEKKIDGVEVTRLDEVLLGDYSIKIKMVSKTKPAQVFGDESTRVGPSRQAEEEEEATERPTAVDDQPAPKVAPAARGGVNEDWDDISSSTEVPISEFRDRGGEPLDADGLDSVLADTGIAEPGGTALAYRSGETPLADVDLDRPPAYSDDDDDEDEDANYVPPYSLVSQLLQEDNIVAKERAVGKPQLEILTLQGDTVADLRLLRPGESFWIGPQLSFLRRRRARDLPKRVRLLKYTRGGAVRVEMRNDVSGTIKRGKQRAKLDQEPNLQKSKRRETKIMGMRKGEVLDIVDGGSRYHVRFVHPPPPSRDPRGMVERVRPDRLLMRSFGGSVGTHIFGLILVYLLVPADIVHSTLRKNDEFVEVTMDAAPEVEEVKQEEEKEEEPPKAEDEKAPPKQNKSKRRSRSGGTTKAPAGVLGLLSKKGSSKAPGPAAAVAAVSNLTAARVPGAAAGYRVSGLIGKLPSNSLSVGGGGGGLMTKGGAALLRGGGGGGGLARGKSRGVGGLVQKNPKAMRSVGQGHLDRDEIQKVINKHIGQVQRCYERELLRTPGLSGKIQVEWTIATSGKVRTARQTYTSMQSTNVSNCILGAIRGWVFPRPRGGEVIVNYPFIFKSIGF